MNFMGMGIMEVAVVLLVAFLVLGPSRTIDSARTAGRILSDLRRSFNEVMEAVNLEQDRDSGPKGRVPTETAAGPATGPATTPAPGVEDPPSPDRRP